MLHMLARVLGGRARNGTMIGSESPAAVRRGQTGGSKVAKFAADFFAVEIRAWRDEEPLWKVFWVYGIGTSVMIAALYAVAVYADRMALRQALLLCFAIYTAWILVLVWRCASNAKEKF